MNPATRNRLSYWLRSLHTGVAVLIPALLALALGLLVAALTLSRRRGRNIMGPFLGRFGAALALMRIAIEGTHHAHRQRPAIFVFNHRSGLDPIILCRVIGTDVIGVAKQELRYNPVLGPLLWFAETIFIDRFHQQQTGSAFLPALAALQRGLSIAIAAEGTRQSEQALGPFRSGAFRLAIAAGVPVVPIVIYDAQRLLAPRSSDLHPGTVHVEVLPPIDTRPWSEHDPAALADHVHALMSARLCHFTAG